MVVQAAAVSTTQTTTVTSTVSQTVTVPGTTIVSIMAVVPITTVNSCPNGMPTLLQASAGDLESMAILPSFKTMVTT